MHCDKTDYLQEAFCLSYIKQAAQVFLEETQWYLQDVINGWKCLVLFRTQQRFTEDPVATISGAVLVKAFLKIVQLRST